MAGRIRSIKPEVLEDEVAAGLSDAAWRLWVSMWVLADDHGGVRASRKYLASVVWQDSGHDADAPLIELIAKGRVHPYAVEGQRYVRIHAWSKHQRVDNAGKPRVPSPEEDDGTWNPLLSSTFAESRGGSPKVAADVQVSPLAQSGGETTTTTTTTTTDRLPPRAAGVPERSVDDLRGKRIPADWKPKDETVRWAAQQGVDANACVEEFVEFWQSIAGAKGRRANWDLVFRGRIRKLLELGRAPSLNAANVPEWRPEPTPDALKPEESKIRVRELFDTLAASKRPVSGAEKGPPRSFETLSARGVANEVQTPLGAAMAAKTGGDSGS